MSGSNTGMVIFIVDDDESVRTGLSRLMRANGHEPRAYSSLSVCLDDIEVLEKPTGCILVDMAMPSLSGLQLQKRLSNSKMKLPIIVVSALVSDAAHEQARQFGARMFLHKPVDGQALLDAIDWLTDSAFTA